MVPPPADFRLKLDAARLLGEGVRSFVQPVFAPDGSAVWFFTLRDGVLELSSANPS